MKTFRLMVLLAITITAMAFTALCLDEYKYCEALHFGFLGTVSFTLLNYFINYSKQENL